MRIRVLGAEHPDEEEATAVVESLIEDPIPNVKGTLVNLLGLRMGVRFVDVNMAYAYAKADPRSDNYEERRAVEVLKKIKEDNPDVLLSLHNPGPNNVRYAAIDPRRGVTAEVLGMLREFGIRHLIAADFGVVTQYSNSVLIEIPKKEIRIDGVAFVRQFIDDLANHSNLPAASATDFEWFAHSTTCGGSLHKDIILPNELSQEERGSIREFGRAPRIIEERLGSLEPLYLTSKVRTPNQAGFWSEILVRVEAPDTSHWPRQL